MPTLGESIVQVKEMEGRSVVLKNLAGYLRTRYLSRDSTPAVAQMRANDGSPIPEAVIEAQARDMETEAAGLEKAVRAAKASEVKDG